MKRFLILFLCLLTLPSVAVGATSIYPGNFLNDLDDVSSESPVTLDILQFDGTAWANRPVFAIPELTDVSITSPQSDDSLLYNGTMWMNVPHTYGELFYHGENGTTLDFSTTTALLNVTGLTNGVANNMSLNDTNGSITIVDTDTYKISLSASFKAASVGIFDLHVGIDGADEDKCHANRKIDNATSVGNTGITCLLELTSGEAVTFLVNSVANETIKFEALNLNLTRIP